MSIAFISDLHLEPVDNNRLHSFIDFLAEAPKKYKSLYIIGDLFEYWVGDDDPHPINKLIQNKIKDAHGQGLSIFFIHGNRDFLLGSQFEKNTGLRIIDDMTVIKDSGISLMIAHGDSFCIDDVEYQDLKKSLRSEEWKKDFLQRPIAERIAFANDLRAKSAESNSNKAENIMDVNQSYVAEVIEKHKIDFLIHGHTHRPAIHKLDNGSSRVVLGSWEDEGWVAEYSKGNIELKSFTI